jgi:hypothetical protein
LRSLRANRASEQANAETQGKQEPTLSTAHARHLPPPMTIDLAFRTELLRIVEANTWCDEPSAFAVRSQALAVNPAAWFTYSGL